MYDYRQKRRPRAAKSRPASKSRSVVMKSTSRRSVFSRRRTQQVPKPRSNEPFLIRLLKTLGSVLLGITIIAICAYFFITKMATYLWPLTTPQTLVLVPPLESSQPVSFVQVLLLDPVTQTAQVAELPGNIALTSTGEVPVSSLTPQIESVVQSQPGALSLQLGRVVDEVVVLPSNNPVRTYSEAKNTFQDLINNDTPNLSKSEKIRWWLFILSLSDTDFRARTMTGFSNWQSWLANVAQSRTNSGCSLALINTTRTSGLSRFLSQIMEQSGYQVIKVDSQPKFLENSQLFINPERMQCLEAAQRLKQFLPEAIEVVPDASVTQQARADIVWLLGNDVALAAEPVMK